MNEIIFVSKVVRLHLRVDDTLQVYITSRNLVKKTDDVICKKIRRLPKYTCAYKFGISTSLIKKNNTYMITSTLNGVKKK